MAKNATKAESNDFADALAAGNAAEAGGEYKHEAFKDEDDFDTLGGQLIYTKPGPNMIVRGILIDRRKRLGKSKKRDGDFYYVIQLTAPCTAYKGAKDVVETIAAKPGDRVTVDERASLEVLRDILEKSQKGDDDFEVIIRCLGEKEVSNNGMEFWPFEVKNRRVPRAN